MMPVSRLIGRRVQIARLVVSMDVVAAGIIMVQAMAQAVAGRPMQMVVANATMAAAAATGGAARLDGMGYDPKIAARATSRGSRASVIAATFGTAVSAGATSAGTSGSIRRLEMQSVGRMTSAKSVRVAMVIGMALATGMVMAMRMVSATVTATVEVNASGSLPRGGRAVIAEASTARLEPVRTGTYLATGRAGGATARHRRSTGSLSCRETATALAVKADAMAQVMAGKAGEMSVAAHIIPALMARAGMVSIARVADGAMAGDRVPSREFSDQDLV